MRRFLVLAALAAFFVLQAAAHASSYIRYGVQDDAWRTYSAIVTVHYVPLSQGTVPGSWPTQAC